MPTRGRPWAILLGPQCPEDDAAVDALIADWLHMALTSHNFRALKKLLDIVD